jgi:hypothetical protein
LRAVLLVLLNAEAARVSGSEFLPAVAVAAAVAVAGETPWAVLAAALLAAAAPTLT